MVLARQQLANFNHISRPLAMMEYLPLKQKAAFLFRCKFKIASKSASQCNKSSPLSEVLISVVMLKVTL